jgi:hypothetical protein
MTLSRTSRALFFAAVVALAAFALLELPRRQSAERAEADAQRLFPPFSAAVDRIEIVRPDARVVLEARGTHWEMAEPVRDTAEYPRIVTLVSSVENAEVERNLGPATDPAAHGLAPPAVTLRMTSGADTLAALEIGALTVDGAFAFARREDGDVVLVPPVLLTAATLSADAFRDQSLIRFDPAEVESFAIRRGRSSIRWTRRGDHAWFAVVERDTVRGDSLAVPAHLGRWRGMRVRSFVDPVDTAGVFSEPDGVVTLYKRAPAPAVTLRFAARPGGVFWGRIDGNPRVIDVDGNVAGALDASPSVLADRRLLHFDPARARRIHVVTPDTSAVLVRAGDAWALPNPALGRVGHSAAIEFVRTLRTLRYTRRVDGNPRDVEPAAFTLQVAAERDTILDELRARPRAGASGRWIVTSRSSRVLAELTEDELNAVVAMLRRLREPSPSRTPSP